MVNIHTLPLGPLQTNCYILSGKDSRKCCVIDPGDQADLVLEYLTDNALTVEAILLTHGHFDHVGAVREIASESGCTVYICPGDLSQPPMMTGGPLFYTDTYDEGTVLSLAGLTIRVIRTPGHTPGSVCLLCGDAIFSGDTLFAGSCGRTDFPGGSQAEMRESLDRLAAMEGSWRVFPGHGESTTLTEEKLYNPYMR